jgi:ABC-type transporter Mla MlaB component
VLRITTNDEPTKLTLKLEGKIMGPWVAELERAWHSVDPVLDDKKLAIDLRGVSYVDHEGRAILAEIYRHTHAQFEADSPLTQYFAQEARSNGLIGATNSGTAVAMEIGSKRSVK